MSNIDGYMLDPNVAREAVRKVESLSYNDLKKEAIKRMQEAGFPDSTFPPGCDTSREGLLDLIAGIEALGKAKRFTP